MPDQIEYIIEPNDKKIFQWKEIWQYRELFYFFAWRDIKVKYKQTVLGLIWVLLQPLFSVLIFSLFFGRALNVPSNGLDYPVFVFSGLLMWNIFSSGINSAANSMLANAGVIKKIYFPRIIIPVSSILGSCVDFIVSFFLFVAVLIYYAPAIDYVKLVLFWPAAIATTFIATLGISCWLAGLNVKYRDFRYVIPFALQVALFLSPVIYPMSILNKGVLNYIFAINPMYAAISLFRAPLIGIAAEPELLTISLASTLVFLVVGIFYFKKTEAFFADIA
jgi:lipopolysaccharide transport system permease protein